MHGVAISVDLFLFSVLYTFAFVLIEPPQLNNKELHL